MGTQIAELLAVAHPRCTVGLVLISPIPLRGYELSPAEFSAFEGASRNRDPEVAAESRKKFVGLQDSGRCQHSGGGIARHPERHGDRGSARLDRRPSAG